MHVQVTGAPVAAENHYALTDGRVEGVAAEEQQRVEVLPLLDGRREPRSATHRLLQQVALYSWNATPCIKSSERIIRVSQYDN